MSGSTKAYSSVLWWRFSVLGFQNKHMSVALITSMRGEDVHMLRAWEDPGTNGRRFGGWRSTAEVPGGSIFGMLQTFLVRSVLQS